MTKEGPGGLDEGYQKMYDAYCAIFSRCGLPYVVVEAESGPIGGDASHEFMVPTDAGEDYLVQSEDGKYAANLERAAVALLPDAHDGKNETLREVHTPNFRTIDEVSGFLNCTPQKMIKTIIYEVGGEPIVALVRGDHEVNEAKLGRVAGVGRVTPAGPELIRKLTGAEVGFAGPVGLNARVIADQAVTVMHDAVTGANKTDYHIVGVNPGRDFTIKESGDVRTAVAGDRAPNGSPLVFRKCIEVGHVFKLGTKYSVAMDARCLDHEGKPRPFIMGCYGIGVTRTLAAVIEAFHDEKGIIWPASVAPFQAAVLALDVRDQAVLSMATKLHDELATAGIDVILDDRDARPGFKFNDADLIGFPYRIVVGKKGLAEGVVELQIRKTGESEKVPPDSAAATVRKRLSA
jgi:prolyl-tRNA synthetase